MRYLIIVFTVILMLTFSNSAETRDRDIKTTGVTINKGSIEMIIGTTEQVTAWVKPEDATDRSIYWFSNDRDIATVRSTSHSSAEVKAKGGGETWITVVTNDGDWRASSKITVIVPVSRVFMEQVELSLEPGDKHQFEAFIEPEEATNPLLHWSSSDNFVISVDETGLAEVVGPGTARVIARSDEDDNIFAYCTVKVGDAVEAEPAEKEPVETVDANQHDEEEIETELDETAEAIDTSDEEQGLEVDYALIAVGAVIVLLLIALTTVIIKKNR